MLRVLLFPLAILKVDSWLCSYNVSDVLAMKAQICRALCADQAPGGVLRMHHLIESQQ